MQLNFKFSITYFFILLDLDGGATLGVGVTFLGGATLDGAVLGSEVLGGATLGVVVLGGAVLGVAVLGGAVLGGAVLGGATLGVTTLEGGVTIIFLPQYGLLQYLY
jgi:uncharacterized protein YjbI with pentapeptide repeats